MPLGSFLRIRSFAALIPHLPFGSASTTQGRQAAYAGLVSIGLRALVLLGKFAFIVILAKATDPATLGIYALLLTVNSLAVYIIGLEIHTFTGREIAADRPGRQGAVHIQSHLVTVAGVFLLALPVIGGVAYALDLSGKFYFALFASIVLAEALSQEFGRYLLMLSRPVASNVLQFIRGAAWMPIPTVLLLLGKSSDPINLVLWNWFAGALAACLFGFWRIREYLTPLHHYRLSWLIKAFSSARYYFAVALLTQVQFYSDRFVVQFFLGESAVGILSFYQSFANTMVTFVQTGVVAVMLPRLILAADQGDVATERRIRRSMLGLSLALAGTIAVGLAIGMPFLLSEMGKGAYRSGLPIFHVLLTANIAIVAGVVVHLSLYARRRDAQLMKVSLVVAPLGLLANLLVVPLFGIAGAAWVFMIAAMVDLGIKSWLLRERFC